MERSTVRLLHKRGKSLRAIANELVPSKSTIRRTTHLSWSSTSSTPPRQTAPTAARAATAFR
jgi:IS30 family transposase